MSKEIDRRRVPNNCNICVYLGMLSNIRIFEYIRILSDIRSFESSCRILRIFRVVEKTSNLPNLRRKVTGWLLAASFENMKISKSFFASEIPGICGTKCRVQQFHPPTLRATPVSH